MKRGLPDGSVNPRMTSGRHPISIVACGSGDAISAFVVSGLSGTRFVLVATPV